MNSLALFEILPALPEVWLIGAGVFLLLLGVFKGDDFFYSISRISIGLILVTLMLVVKVAHSQRVAFHNMFVSNDFTVFAKVLILIGTAVAIALAMGYLRHEEDRKGKLEFPVLMLFAAVGMMVMVSANNLITLYVGLELQSLSLYVLASIDRLSPKSSEAGLKYFVLGALASGILLYGSSLIYGFTGSVDFAAIAALYKDGFTLLPGVLVGLILVIIGFCFKMSAVPFHMWTPDVYEGAPTPVTAFFSVAPKVAALTLFIRLLLEPFGHSANAWQQVVIFVSIASMVIGALGALRQKNIKRLLAYSSIGHVGYALVGVATASSTGISSVLVYLAIYITMSLGAFSCVIMMHDRERHFEEIDDFSGLARTHPLRAAMLAVFMFSMTGIPPLAGFFGKYFVFLSAVQSGFYALAVIGVLSSVIAAYYYLRIVKVMYFDEPRHTLSKDISSETMIIAYATALFNLLFFIFPTPLLNLAKEAAAILFA